MRDRSSTLTRPGLVHAFLDQDEAGRTLDLQRSLARGAYEVPDPPLTGRRSDDWSRRSASRVERERTPLRLDVPGITTSASPFPSAVVAGDLVFVSDQVSFDDSGSVVGEGDVTAQTRQVLERLQRVLHECGATLDDVVSTTAYLTRSSYAAPFNAEWSRWFADRRPARATVVAQLLDERLLVEVQAIAVRSTTAR